MAFGVAGIGQVEAWTAASYAADDGSLDADNTSCMLNGTVGEDCDEVKEGTINLRVEIEHAPASIISLSIRFYLNSIMNAGDNAVLPYTDANSVSTTNEDVQDYTTTGQWIEHNDLGDAFIAQLADISGSCYVRLSSSDAAAKSKIGEVNIDITVQTYELAGVTRDVDDAVLATCEYQIFQRTGLGPETWSLSVAGTSNGSGVFAEELGRATYRIVYLKDVEPQVQHIGPPLTMAEVATDDIFTLGTFSGLANDDEVQIYQAAGDALPTGVSEGVDYFVVQTSGDTIKLSLTQGGSAIDITVLGVCWIAGKPETS